MRITLDIDEDVLAAAWKLATSERCPLGSVVSQLARQSLTTARIASRDGVPVIRVPEGTPSITPGMARRALGED